jgi:hypothetical protein
MKKIADNPFTSALQNMAIRMPTLLEEPRALRVALAKQLAHFFNRLPKP